MPFGILTLGLYAAWDDGISNFAMQCDSVISFWLVAGAGGASAEFAYILGHLRKLLVSGVCYLSKHVATRYIPLRPLASTSLQLEVDHAQRLNFCRHVVGIGGLQTVLDSSHWRMQGSLPETSGIETSGFTGFTIYKRTAGDYMRLPLLQLSQMVSCPWTNICWSCEDASRGGIPPAASSHGRSDEAL